MEEFVLRPLKRDPTALHYQSLKVIMRIAGALYTGFDLGLKNLIEIKIVLQAYTGSGFSAESTYKNLL